MKRIRRRSDLPRERRQATARQTPQQRAEMEAFGELEFRASIDPEMDPVSSLGYEPGKARAHFDQLFEPGIGELGGVYNPPNSRQGEGEKLSWMTAVQQQTDQAIRIGDVVVARDYIDNPETWAHEFRHRGMNDLRTRFTQDEFAEKYGSEAADFLFNEQDMEEDLVTWATKSTDETDNTVHEHVNSRAPALMMALNEAALDAIENDRLTAAERKEASGWLRRFFGGGSE